MLAYVNNNSVSIWNGERLPNGLSVQVNVGELWTEEELNAVGLYIVQMFVIPAGQQITGQPTYTFTGSSITETWPTIPLPPPVVRTTTIGGTTVIN